MSFEWKEYQLMDVALESPHAMSTGPFGSSISSKFFQETGVPVIRGGNLSSDISNRMSDEGLVFISKDKAEEFRRSVVRSGDLIFTCWGTINQVGLITDDLKYSEYIISNKQMKVTVDPRKADHLFLYYLFSSPLKQAEILSNAIGAAVPGFNLGQLKKHIIYLPSVEEQRRISSILNSFDKKIRHNKDANQTLEQIAQALFKSWFVDFDPTRAKIAAKEAGASPEEIERAAMCAISGKTPDQLAQLPPETQQNLKTTAALFPDALVDSELGEVPEGWGVKAMGHYLDTISKTYPLKTVDKVIFLNTGDIQNGQFLHAEYSEASSLPGQAKKSIQKNDILYSEIRPENKRFAFVNFDAPHHVVSTKLMVLRATKDISSLLLYFILTQQSTVDHLQMLAESRSGTFPQITFDHLSKIEFIAPFDNLLINKFVETVLEPSFQTQKMRDAENACLIELRDSLLPKLLSGEIQLKKNGETKNV